MKRSIKAAVIAATMLLAPALAGCGTGLSTYQPKLVAQGELLLRYDNHFEIYTADRPVAQGIRYAGLADFVRCVPNAHRHAEEAQSDGATGYGLSIAGGALAVVGLGGLSGLAFYEKDTTTMAALLGAGIGLEVVGLVMAIVSRGYKASANGHAVDAVNYYNDAVGSLGGSCDRPVPAAPPASAPPASPSPASPPPEEGAPASKAPPPPLAPRVDVLGTRR
jgi:hypothetical protein